jgi:putative membrane protein
MVDDLGWWSVPIVSVVIFTLYGIEGIGSQLEDPFGYDRNDIKMDAIVEDERVEMEAILNEWRRVVTANNETQPDGPIDTNVQTNGVDDLMPKTEMFIR